MGGIKETSGYFLFHPSLSPSPPPSPFPFPPVSPLLCLPPRLLSPSVSVSLSLFLSPSPRSSPPLFSFPSPSLPLSHTLLNCFTTKIITRTRFPVAMWIAKLGDSIPLDVGMVVWVFAQIRCPHARWPCLVLQAKQGGLEGDTAGSPYLMWPSHAETAYKYIPCP